MSIGLATNKKSTPVLLVSGALVLVLAIVGFLYLRRAPSTGSGEVSASPEAKAYVANLRLADVKMQATENFMKQQVVEIEGKIGNEGPRTLRSVDVYCLFYGVDGREIHRERLPMVTARGAGLKPHEVRPFRLPFDTLPDGWNQAMPRLVIANINFTD